MSKFVTNRINGIYIITDGRYAGKDGHVTIAHAAVRAGAPCVQLRAPELSDRNLLEVAKEIAQLTRNTGALFIVNNRVDIALASGADGVHLGQDDMPCKDARRILGPDAIIGISVGTVDEAIEAQAEGTDYIAIGPIFPTLTKTDAGDAVGLEAITNVNRAVDLPVVAIGGISLANIASVRSAGADSAAVISAVSTAPDIEEAVRTLAERFTCQE
ncbi:MAG TPA: thiamine phosphate synthase [Armatimonadota bacterium]|nr:thiamine phosphate synthase [Armatimonadota bacterium]